MDSTKGKEYENQSEDNAADGRIPISVSHLNKFALIKQQLLQSEAPPPYHVFS